MLERLVGRGEDRASLEHSALGEAPRESYRELKALAAKYPNISKKANEIGNEILEYISPFDGYFEKQEKSNFTKKKAGSDNLLNSFKEATSLVFRDPTARTKETQKMASWGKTPHFVAHGISGKGKDTNNDDEIPTWVEAKVNMIKRTTLKNKQDKQISQLWRNMMVNFAPLGIGKNTIYAFNALCGVEGASEYGRNIVVGDEELLMIKREVENSQVALQTTDLKINKQFFLFLVPLVHSLAVLIRRWCLDEMNEKLVLEKYNKPDACPFFSIGCLPFVFYEESKSLVTDFNVDNKTRYPSLLSPGASFISATSEKRRVLTLYAQLYAFAYIFNNVPSALSGCHVLQKELWVQLLFDHKLPYYFLNMLNFSGRCHVDSLLKPLVDQLDLDNSQLQDFSLPGDEPAQYDKPKTFKHLQLSHVPSAYESSEHTEQSDRHKEAGTPNILKSSYVFGPQFHSDYLFYINKNSSIENEIDEETLKKQDVFIYEILDEMVDFGYIQNTEIGNMKHNLGSKKSIGSSLSGGKFENADWDMQQKVMASRGAVLWRRNDIIYKKNRVFIDVLESINVLVGSKGVVSKMEVEGRVIVKSYLSGIPKCTLGFNQKLLKSIPNDSEQPNKMEITDRVFHQCVEQSEGNVIKFIPPDGQFELMRYRSSGQFELPFAVLVDTTDNSKNSRTEIQVLIKSKFSEQMAANNVLLLIPTPQNTTSCEFLIQGSSFFASNVSYNSRAKFNPSQNAVIWKLYRFQGNTEYSISIKAKLLGSAKPWVGNKPPLQLYFDIPQYSLTGLQVKFMQVDCDKQYNSTKFVKNSVNAGSFLIRVSDILLV
ncbi:AP-2 complex subunit mu [Zancudomyces culisetae]|uniref:AP-2 complex subunit mu n=1 Tax=Zancudomyces culisetae TaxID=1213189 RepID=A0A1R1PRT0_ZANCU|nr:AP-2 complex subunit mu [Zancudomyces culisetae]|eukprot:OMH83658.1 AP-2 complex subunit mu [Zancudomyces culisetae]